MAKRAHRELSLEDKIKLIKSRDLTNAPHRELADQFGIGKTTVSDILKRKDVYIKQFEESLPINRKRKERKTDISKVNELMFQWFQIARERGIPISGPLLQEKARKYTEELGISKFTASNGWLATFKSRHEIKTFRVNGESLDVNPVTVDNWKGRLADIQQAFVRKTFSTVMKLGYFSMHYQTQLLQPKEANALEGKAFA